MLEYSIHADSYPVHITQAKSHPTNRYRQKHNIPSQTSNIACQKSNFPLCPSLAKAKHKAAYHSQNDSIDTCESDQSLSSLKRTKSNKLKVQLCKNYTEKGYCPYEDRCRFAHGVQELRAKDTHCSSELYRTRKCKVFFEKNQCKFGERCNFMHDSRNWNEIVGARAQLLRSALRGQFLEVGVASAGNKLSSRLLSILQIEQKSP